MALPSRAVTSTHYQKEIILPFRAKQFKPPQWRPPPAKVADPYYQSTAWRELRAKRLAMDKGERYRHPVALAA
jgi:hypothetical protein